MSSVLAILTYNRLHSLKVAMDSCKEHWQIGIFEDCGLLDGTREWLRTLNHPNRRTFISPENLGVAGNSNRALWWFMNETDADHLVLANDDVAYTGDILGWYQKAHDETGIHLFCFHDPTSPIYGEATQVEWPINGIQLVDRPRLHGSCMSLTRHLVETIGFMDPIFGRFGEEHCDYTHRARAAGLMDLGGRSLNCPDTWNTPARQLDVEPSVHGIDRVRADDRASRMMAAIGPSVFLKDPYRPFVLKKTELVEEIPAEGLPTYHFI